MRGVTATNFSYFFHIFNFFMKFDFCCLHNLRHRTVIYRTQKQGGQWFKVLLTRFQWPKSNTFLAQSNILRQNLDPVPCTESSKHHRILQDLSMPIVFKEIPCTWIRAVFLGAWSKTKQVGSYRLQNKQQETIESLTAQSNYLSSCQIVAKVFYNTTMYQSCSI